MKYAHQVTFGDTWEEIHGWNSDYSLVESIWLLSNKTWNEGIWLRKGVGSGSISPSKWQYLVSTPSEIDDVYRNTWDFLEPRKLFFGATNRWCLVHLFNDVLSNLLRKKHSFLPTKRLFCQSINVCLFVTRLSIPTTIFCFPVQPPTIWIPTCSKYSISCI